MAKKTATPAASLRDHEHALDDAVARPAPVTAIFGDEPFLRDAALARVLQALDQQYPGLEHVVLRAGPQDGGPALDYGALLREIGGSSLFARQKVIVLRDAGRLFFPGGAANTDDDGDSSGEAPPDDVAVDGRRAAGPEHLAARLNGAWPEDVWLVVECATLPKNRVIGKALWAHARVVPCPTVTREGELVDWLRRRAAGLGRPLTPGAAQWLVQAHGGNLGVLAGELEKLSLYLADGEHADDAAITEDVVSLFFAGTEEFHAFALTNAIESRDAGEAMRIVRLVTEQGARDQGGKRRDAMQSAQAMLMRLPSTVLGLLAGGMARELGGGVRAVAEWTKTAPFRAEKLARGAEAYTLPELRRAVTNLAEEIRATNDTGGDARLALERVVAAMVGRPRRD